MKKILNKWVLVNKNEYDSINKKIVELQNNLDNDKNYHYEKLELQSKYDKLKKLYDQAKNSLILITNDYGSLIINYRKLAGSKGNLQKQINETQKELTETKQKLADSMTDKYLVRKIPEGRTKKTTKMQSIRPVNREVNVFLKKEIEDVRNG